MKYSIVFLLFLITAANAQHSNTSRNSANLSSIPTSIVANLPACNAGRLNNIVNVTDATTPAVGSTVVGGGAVTTLVHCNGANWIVG